MNYQNKKNGNLILMKNRRILTRTEQSKQKLKANLNSNNFVYKTHRQQQPKIIKNSQRKNYTQHKFIQNDRLDHTIFWKAAKNKKIKAECYSNKKTQSLYENLSPRNHQKINDRPKVVYSKSNSRVYSILKKKIFSHKNLNQGIERIRSNTSQSTLRINNDNSIQNEIPSDNTQNQDSQRVTQRSYFLKRIKNFTKRFKTQNIQTEQQNVEKILKNIYSSRRRKLRLNSNEYSVELRMNGKKQIQQQKVQKLQSENTLITTRTQNKKSLLKLPQQLINKIKQKSDKSQAVSSPVNLSFSSDNDNFQRRNFNIQHKKSLNKNQVMIPSNRQKSKTLFSKQIMSKIEQQNSFRQKEYYQPEIITLKKNKDQRFIKKQTHHVVKNKDSKIFESQTISIQDIEVVCLNQSQNITKQKLILQNDEKIYKKTIEKTQTNRKNRDLDEKLIVSYPLEKKIRKIKLKQQNSLKNFEKHKRYEDNQQPGFMEQINLNDKKPEISIQIQSSPNIHKPLQQSKQILNTYTIQSIQIDKTKRQTFQKQQEYQIDKKEQDECQRMKIIKLKQSKYQFLKLKNQVQQLNCIGEVGGQCSQYFPKKNLTWMVPTLLLYLFCLDFRKNAEQQFSTALKSQFCPKTEYENFIEQNQQLQLNISKIYQKAKKKNLITQQIQAFILPNSTKIQQKTIFFNILFNQIVKFIESLQENQSEKSISNKQLNFCGIKTTLAFLTALNTEKYRQYLLEDIQSYLQNIEIFKIPQINFSNLSQKQTVTILEQSLKLIKQSFKIFQKSIKN